AFVQAGIDEAMKLERALSQLRTEKRVIVLHYAPIVDTVKGEPAEIYPYLGSSRLSEVADRHGASLIVHGHAHHGALDGKTTGGIPVHNVALNMMLQHNGGRPYRVFDI
ncbi:MAG TPA: metallophosphoesterase, partial [Clostridia bacterium]|nr:metallophosphoesterase [Clostridia bacterium]